MLHIIDDTIADGDKLVQRLTGHGTMQGSLAGMPATGKHAPWSEIHVSCFKDGKVVEHWAADRLRSSQVAFEPIHNAFQKIEHVIRFRDGMLLTRVDD
jgi:predicted ester cyclase